MVWGNDSSLGLQLQEGSSTIHIGLFETHLIAVVADDDNISLFVDKKLITTTQDNTSLTGQVGVLAEAISNPTTIVYFNFAEVWTL